MSQRVYKTKNKSISLFCEKKDYFIKAKKTFEILSDISIIIEQKTMSFSTYVHIKQVQCKLLKY